jgi:hypothetical protein
MLITLALAAFAAPPGLRVVAADGSPAPDGGTLFSVYQVEMSPNGDVLVEGSVDFVDTLMRFHDDALHRVETPGNTNGRNVFAAENAVFLSGGVLWEVPFGQSPSRLVGIGETVGDRALGSITVLSGDRLGNTLISADNSLVLVDGIGEAARVLDAGREVLGAPDGYRLDTVVTSQGVFLNDDGELSAMLYPEDDDVETTVLMHGLYPDWGPYEMNLIPDPNGADNAVPFCCNLLGVGATGFHVVEGGYSNPTTLEFQTWVFAGLPSVMGEAVHIPATGLTIDGAVGEVRDWTRGVTSTVVGHQGAFTTLVDLYRDDDSTRDAIVLAQNGVAPIVVATSETEVGGEAIGSLDEVCGITASRVIFNAENADGQSVYAWDRQSHMLERWWGPGTVVTHPTEGDVTAVDVRCKGPSRIWEQDQALVWLDWEQDGQSRAIVLDGGVAAEAEPADLVVNATVDATTTTTFQFTVEVRNLGDQAAQTVGFDVTSEGDLAMTTEGTAPEGCVVVDGAQWSCAIGTLEPGQGGVYTFTVARRVDATAYDVVGYTVSPEPTLANNTATVRSEALNPEDLEDRGCRRSDASAVGVWLLPWFGVGFARRRR